MAHSTFKVGDLTAVIGDNDICEQRAKEAIAVLAKTAAKQKVYLNRNDAVGARPSGRRKVAGPSVWRASRH